MTLSAAKERGVQLVAALLYTTRWGLLNQPDS